jgi:WD40 repeat protein
VADVFISYSRRDRSLAEVVATQIRAIGLTVWWDAELNSGDQFRNRIDAELEAAKVVIVIWSHSSISSKWVIAEADHAEATGKILPLRTSDTSTSQIPKPFNTYHTAIIDNSNATITTALELIFRKISPDSPLPEAFHKAKARSASRRRFIWLGSASCVGALAVTWLESQRKYSAVWQFLNDQSFGTIPHPAVIVAVARNSQGLAFASGGGDRIIRLYDRLHGQAPKATLVGHENEVQSLGFSGDGLLIASGSADKTVRLWSASTGEELGRLLLDGAARSIAFDKRQKTLMIGDTWGMVNIWNYAERKHERFKEHTAPVFSLAYTNDDRYLLSASADSTVGVWDISRRVIVRRFQKHVASLWAVACSPDARIAASAGDDKNILIWDYDTGEQLRELRGHRDVVRSLSFSPDGNWLVSGSEDATVRVWDVATGAAAATYEGHKNKVTSIATSFVDIVSGSWDGTVKLWRYPRR